MYTYGYLIYIPIMKIQKNENGGTKIVANSMRNNIFIIKFFQILSQFGARYWEQEEEQDEENEQFDDVIMLI